MPSIEKQTKSLKHTIPNIQLYKIHSSNRPHASVKGKLGLTRLRCVRELWDIHLCPCALRCVVLAYALYSLNCVGHFTDSVLTCLSSSNFNLFFILFLFHLLWRIWKLKGFINATEYTLSVTVHSHLPFFHSDGTNSQDYWPNFCKRSPTICFSSNGFTDELH